MVGNQGVKCHNQQKDKGADFVGAQRGNKVGDASREQAHLEEGVDGDGSHHISCQGKSYMVEKAKNKRVNPWVMVRPGNDAEDLFQLVNAVGSHNARILIEIVGEPAEQAAQESAQGSMAADKIRKCRKPCGEVGTASFISISHVLIAGEQHPVQPFSIAGIGI